MDDIIKKIKLIEDSICTSKVIINDITFGINLYYLKEYDEISKYIDELYKENKIHVERKKILTYIEELLISKRRIYRRIVRNILSNNCNIILKCDRDYNDEDIKRDLEKWWKLYDDKKNILDNISDFLIAKIETKIWEINNELLIIDQHPSIYYNTYKNYVGSNFSLKYRDDIIKYKNVDIRADVSHSYALFSNDESKESDEITLLNIISFFDCQPYYYMTDNSRYNDKLSILYEQFDILDIVKLRKKDFLNNDIDEPFILVKPLLKSKSYLVNFYELEHEEILDLYHSSLKQIEPLPRCIFLYRVFEYGASQHYKKKFKPIEYKPEDALNYYILECLKYNFNPIYYNDYGRYYNYYSNEFIEKRKPQLRNFIIVLKKEVKEILEEWKQHEYLKTKKGPGDIIYNTGRNLVAHGANGKRNMKYDYNRNYKHINDINIVLELIARYLVEILNPQLRNRVERRKKYYSKNWK